MATNAQSAKSAPPKKGGPDETAEEPTKPKKSGKKLIFVIVLLLILVGGGGGAWWYFMGSAGNDDKSAKAEKATTPIFLPIEPFTVNLQPEAGEHYLQIAITLQVATKEDVDQIKVYMPQFRSRLLFLLTSKKGSEIATLEGKKKLSEEIKAQMNMPVASGVKPLEVVNVFFTSFVIQ